MERAEQSETQSRAERGGAQSRAERSGAERRTERHRSALALDRAPDVTHRLRTSSQDASPPSRIGSDRIGSVLIPAGPMQRLQNGPGAAPGLSSTTANLLRGHPLVALRAECRPHRNSFAPTSFPAALFPGPTGGLSATRPPHSRRSCRPPPTRFFGRASARAAPTSAARCGLPPQIRCGHKT